MRITNAVVVRARRRDRMTRSLDGKDRVKAVDLGPDRRGKVLRGYARQLGTCF